MMSQKPAPQSNIATIIRPPVIAVMGHIDHGKSTLLDYIRHSNIVGKEAGGITQHVGAYEVVHTGKDGKPHKITFLDTPGHEAFKGIRERGADVADIAILVVSAEEGVKPQTLEALKFILESKTPYIVAINKIDKPGADIERTKQNMAENEIYLEGHGGSIPFVPISAKTGQGVEDLLDMMLLVAELEELTGDASKPAEGVIIEAHLDPKKGITATLIVKNGTLNKGTFIVAENSFTPVRGIENTSGVKCESACFSSPIRITGWNVMPNVGAQFKIVETKKEAEGLISKKIEARTVAKKTAEDTRTELFVIIKADVAGSLEALEQEIKKLETDRLSLRIIGKGVGAITETDIKTAAGVKDPFVLGFNTEADAQAKNAAERLGITIRTFDIIYKLIEWLSAEAIKRVPKQAHDEVLGNARILKIFGKEKDRQIIGGKVENGTLTAGSSFKIMRRGFEVGQGKIRGLQHLKAKTDEVQKGMEFGAMTESKIEIASGDFIETFVTTLQ